MQITQKTIKEKNFCTYCIKTKKRSILATKEIISKGGEKMKMVKEWILILLVILFSYAGFLFVSVPLWLFWIFLERIKKVFFE